MPNPNPGSQCGPRIVRPGLGGMFSAPRGLQSGGGPYNLARLPAGRMNAGGRLYFPTNWCSVVESEPSTPHAGEAVVSAQSSQQAYAEHYHSIIVMTFPKVNNQYSPPFTSFWYLGDVSFDTMPWMQDWPTYKGFSCYHQNYYMRKGYNYALYLTAKYFEDDIDCDILTWNNVWSYIRVTFGASYTSEFRRIYPDSSVSEDWVLTGTSKLTFDSTVYPGHCSLGMPIFVPIREGAKGLYVTANWTTSGSSGTPRSVLTLAPAVP